MKISELVGRTGVPKETIHQLNRHRVFRMTKLKKLKISRRAKL
jgi:hypothetical protein